MDPGGGAARRQPTRTRSDQTPCRPLSAYNFFFKEERARLVEESHRKGNEAILEEATDGAPQEGKGEGSNLFGALGKVIGKHWKQLSPKKREKYEAMAEQDKLRYKREKKAFRKRMMQKSPSYLASQQEKRSNNGGGRGGGVELTATGSRQQIIGVSGQLRATASDHQQSEFGRAGATGQLFPTQNTSSLLPGHGSSQLQPHSHSTAASINQGLQGASTLCVADSQIASLLQQQQIQQSLLLDQLLRQSGNIQQPLHSVGSAADSYLMLQLLQQQEHQSALTNHFQPNLALLGINPRLALSGSIQGGTGGRGDSDEQQTWSLLRIQRESQELEELLRNHRHRDV